MLRPLITTRQTLDDECILPSVGNDYIISRIEAMRRQEEGAYAYRGLKRCFPQNEANLNGLPIEECIAKMVDWSYQLVDFCKIRRENVTIAISHLGRFIHTEQGVKSLEDRDEFQLATITALYLSIKTIETGVISPQLMSKICRGNHSSEEIVKMEQTMLDALQWRVHPPTPLSFVRDFLALLLCDDKVDKSFGDDALAFSKFQVELAVRDYFFVDVKPSVIAYAAILNALLRVGVEDMSSYTLVLEVIHKIEPKLHLASSSRELREVRERLMEAFNNNTDETPNRALHLSRPKENLDQGGNFESGKQSPRCVSQQAPVSPAGMFHCGLLDALAFT